MNGELATEHQAELIASLRDARQTAAAAHLTAVIKWLAAAEIAVPAIYRIAATNNVQAREAALLLEPILQIASPVKPNP